MIPTIGIKGSFTFTEPYAHLTNPNQQYTVTSVRTIPELQASGEKPFETIYVAAGETDAVFKADVDGNVPIVTFMTDGGEYFYVPANKIASDAKQDGVRYKEKALMINLGYLPEDENLDTLLSNIKDFIYNSIGVVTEPLYTNTSSTVYISKTKHDTLLAERANAKTINKSYKTQYAELLVLYTQQQDLINNIEKVYAANGIGG